MYRIKRFFIPGIPFGKQRPRAMMRAGYVQMYTPSKTLNWEEYIKWMCVEYRPNWDIRGAVGIQAHFYFPRPKSVSKKIQYHLKKPDIDNLAKSLLDGMNGIFYIDDKQVYELHVYKFYCEDLDKPGISIQVTYIE